jgi:hypothetical protein
VRRIQQRGMQDCTIATLAMLLEVEYEDALQLLAQPFAAGRVDDRHLDQALGIAGYASIRKYMFDAMTASRRVEWPPAPFGPKHWALVEVANGGHAVAMEADGTVLDPFAPWRTTLSHLEYVKVCHVTAIWKVDVAHGAA